MLDVYGGEHKTLASREYEQCDAFIHMLCSRWTLMRSACLRHAGWPRSNVRFPLGADAEGHRRACVGRFNRVAGRRSKRARGGVGRAKNVAGEVVEVGLRHAPKSRITIMDIGLKRVLTMVKTGVKTGPP